MWKIVAIVLAVVVAGILAAAAMQPDSFTVQRSIVINAPAGKIYPMIVDLRGWKAWSPWENVDPEMKRTFSGSEAGKGAVYEWAGNGQVGAGRMEITEATAPGHVTIALHFREPLEGHNIAEFILDPRGDTTRVTWSMHGPSRFITKLMGVFYSMDKMIGSSFENGLSNLKALAEKSPARPA